MIDCVLNGRTFSTLINIFFSRHVINIHCQLNWLLDSFPCITQKEYWAWNSHWSSFEWFATCVREPFDVSVIFYSKGLNKIRIPVAFVGFNVFNTIDFNAIGFSLAEHLFRRFFYVHSTIAIRILFILINIFIDCDK